MIFRSNKEKYHLVASDFTSILVYETELDSSSTITTESSLTVSSSCFMCIPGNTSLPGTKAVISISSSRLLEGTGNIGSMCSDSVFAKYSVTFDARSSVV